MVSLLRPARRSCNPWRSYLWVYTTNLPVRISVGSVLNFREVQLQSLRHQIS
jgi:hypothetical protein